LSTRPHLVNCKVMSVLETPEQIRATCILRRAWQQLAGAESGDKSPHSKMVAAGQ
jgi:hypothetical protein